MARGMQVAGMSTNKDLSGGEAVAKVREIVDSTSICMLGTGFIKIPAHFVPMGALEVDEDGAVWFFSGADSEHNINIERDPRAQLIFSRPGNIEFMTLFGEVEVVRDRQLFEKLWKPTFRAWFPEGVDDPNLTLLKVMPNEGHYWETADGKVVSMAKIIYSALTESYTDGAVEGELRI